MLTYPNIRYSERDCRENPAKHHKMKKITITRQIQNGAMQIGTESPFQHPSPSSRLRSFVAMVLGAKAPHITETSSFHNPVAKCLPPQRLLQTQLATGREEGKHFAIIKFYLLNPLQVLKFGYLVSI